MSLNLREFLGKTAAAAGGVLIAGRIPSVPRGANPANAEATNVPPSSDANLRLPVGDLDALYDHAIKIASETDPKQVNRFRRLKAMSVVPKDTDQAEIASLQQREGPTPIKEGQRQIRVDFGQPIETKPDFAGRGTTLEEYRISRFRTNRQAGLTAVLHDNGLMRFVDMNASRVITRGEVDLREYYGSANNIYDFKVTDSVELLVAPGYYDDTAGFKIDGVRLLDLKAGDRGREITRYNLEDSHNDLRIGTSGDVVVIAELSGGWEGEDDKAKYHGRTKVKSFRKTDLSNPIQEIELNTGSLDNHDGEVYTMAEGNMLYLHGDQAVVFNNDGGIRHHVQFPPESRLDDMWVYDPISQQIVTVMPGIQWDYDERPASGVVTADASGLADGRAIRPKNMKVEDGMRYYDGATFPGFYYFGRQWPETDHGHLTAPVYQPGLLEGAEQEWWKGRVLGVMDLTQSHVPESVTLIPENHNIDRVEPGVACLDSQVIPYNLSLAGGRAFLPFAQR